MLEALVKRPFRKIEKEHLILGVVLLLNIILVSPKVMPTYLEINAFDEAKYIESGRLLLLGEVRNLSWGPIVAVLYAPLHLLFGHLPDWFVIEARAGRLILFTFLWLTTFQLGKQLRRWINPYVLMGALFIGTGIIGVLSNQSDAIFTGFSALSLGQLLAFRRDLNLRHIWLGSLYLGLAILARFEGIVLLPVFLGICIWLGRAGKKFGKLILNFLLPIIILASVYLFVFWLSTGTFELGVQGKSWDSFEVNQPLPEWSSDNQAQRELTKKLFGTREENQGSIFRAFQRNPIAFMQRITTNLVRTPRRYLDLFGNRLGPAYAIFAIIGLIGMVTKGKWEVPAIFLLWSIQPAVSLIFLPLHFLKQLVFLPIIFASIGLSEKGVRSPKTSVHRRVAIALFSLLILYSAIDSKPAFLVTGIVILAALLIGTIVKSQQLTIGSSGYLVLLLLPAGLILRPAFEFPNYPPVGQTNQELVVHHLLEEMPAESKIIEPLPLPAVASKLQDLKPDVLPDDLETSEDLHLWLTNNQIAALYNPRHYSDSAKLIELLVSGEGEYFKNSLTLENGNLEVWMVLEH